MMTRATALHDALELLQELIATPRTSRNEEAAADLLELRMREWGMQPQRHGNNLWEIAPGPSSSGSRLIKGSDPLIRRDASRPTLLLNAHIDTVKPVSAWTRDPYLPQFEPCPLKPQQSQPQSQPQNEVPFLAIHGEASSSAPSTRLYGLGSNDDGASLVSLLAVYRALRETELPYNLIFLASAEEEVSGANGISSVLPLLPPIDVALVGEPTGMQPAIAEKGLMVLDCTAHGIAGHAARNEGDNAIYRALRDIAWLQSYQFPNQTDLLGPVKMTTTIINAGTQHNVIPDECTFTVDVRSNECYSNEEIYRKVCESLESDVKARSFRLNSSRIDLAHPLVQRAIALGKTPFGSPTLSDQALMPFPSMKMGPGDSRRSHTADEYILVSEIEEAIDTYTKLLNNLSLPPQREGI